MTLFRTKSGRTGMVLSATVCLLASGAGAQRSGRPPGQFDVVEKTIPELQAAMASGAVTSRELVEHYLARIEAYDKRGPRLNAMIAINPRALEAADALDRERRERGPRGPLHGIPIVVKDNYETEELPTTGGSEALAGFETHRDAFQVARLRAAGAVLLGKTNLHELAAGIITVSSLGGQTRNPYDPARTPGGSSGGSGAAVAASFAAAATASDTCGSIRIPAANNNLFGLRGTAGLSSRAGIIPLSHTQDIGGPVARTITDLAIMLDATVGPDPDDPASLAGEGHIPASFRDGLQESALQGARIGLLKNLFGTAPEDEEVAGLVRKALDAIKPHGVELVEVTVPGLDETLQGSSLINHEFKTDLIAYLSQFPNAPVRSLADILEKGAFHAALETTFKQRNAFEPDAEAIRRVHAKRAQAQRLIVGALDEHRLDALAYPTLRRRPVVVEEPQRGTNCQLSASTGFPALAVPAGFTDDGVPIGMELLGPAWSDARLLAMGFAYEQAMKPRRSPPTTPALVAGKVPAPSMFRLAPEASNPGLPMSMTGRYDRISGQLSYEFHGLTAGDAVLAAAIHRGPAGSDGPVIARLANPAAPSAAGEVVLAPYQRRWLEEGRLVVTLRTKNDPGRAVSIPLRGF
jgi:Asp-tRNA(Asn)/Glu-tRNA(Gln) amidotransferase A subunit family amidase